MGIEPTIGLLQSPAFPLGYLATIKIDKAFRTVHSGWARPAEWGVLKFHFLADLGAGNGSRTRLELLGKQLPHHVGFSRIGALFPLMIFRGDHQRIQRVGHSANPAPLEL